MSVTLNYPGVCNLFDFLLSREKVFIFLTICGTSVGELYHGPCLQKKKKKSLIVWVSHSCLSTCWFSLATLLETGSLREDFVTSIMILLWACQSSSDSGRVSPVGSWCLFSFLFTPQGISSLCLREWTEYNFLYIGWDSVSKCIPSIGQSLFNLFPKWYFQAIFFFLITFNGRFCFTWI